MSKANLDQSKNVVLTKYLIELVHTEDPEVLMNRKNGYQGSVK